MSISEEKHYQQLPGGPQGSGNHIKSRVICRHKCDQLDDDGEYMGDSARTFGERLKELLRVPSPVFDHSNTKGHRTSVINFTTFGMNSHSLELFCIAFILCMCELAVLEHGAAN